MHDLAACLIYTVYASLKFWGFFYSVSPSSLFYSVSSEAEVFTDLLRGDDMYWLEYDICSVNEIQSVGHVPILIFINIHMLLRSVSPLLSENK